MKSIRILLFSLIISLSTLFPSVVCAGDSSNMVAVADSLYRSGDYKKASDAYLAIVREQGISAQLYFNLANSYAQSGNYGGAILYYSRAERLDPGNKDIRNNLKYFSSKVEDSNRAELRGKKISVSPDPETFFTTAHRMIAADVKSDTWAFWGVVSFILCLMGVAVYLFCGNVMLRKIGFFGGFCLLLLSVMFTVFAFMGASYFNSSNQAVLMTYKTELKIEPSADAKPATNLLCQGTMFDIVAEESDVDGKPTWYRVRLNANVEGWLRAEDVEII